jgi:hypothetical protein
MVPDASEATGEDGKLCDADALPEIGTLLSAARRFEADEGIDGPSAGVFPITVA